MPRASEFRQLLRNKFLNRGLSAVQHENGCELTLNKFSGNITVAAGCKISRSTLSGQVNVAAYTSINGPNIGIFSKLNPINIGKFCSIASGVRMQEFNHFSSRVSTYFIQKNIFNAGINSDIESNGPILIHDDVWIGANAIILSGVSIGKGAIIAAGSVVTKSVPAYAICAGVPAKVVKFRFSQPVIDHLNELNWTSWGIEKIRRNKGFFMLSGDAILEAQTF